MNEKRIAFSNIRLAFVALPVWFAEPSVMLLENANSAAKLFCVAKDFLQKLAHVILVFAMSTSETMSNLNFSQNLVQGGTVELMNTWKSYRNSALQFIMKMNAVPFHGSVVSIFLFYFHFIYL